MKTMFSKTLIATALISLVAGISAAQDSPKPAATPKVELNELE
jgi:hypothetical protein